MSKCQNIKIPVFYCVINPIIKYEEIFLKNVLNSSDDTYLKYVLHNFENSYKTSSTVVKLDTLPIRIS